MALIVGCFVTRCRSFFAMTERHDREGGFNQAQKHVVARERSDRTRPCLPAGRNPIGVKVLSFIFILIFQVFQVFQVPPSAAAWGSITHSAICRDAGGSEIYIMGGVAPDMIALRSVTTGDSSFDYAHNCYGDSREPVFGAILAGVSSSDFAPGWRAHQLADSVVHGPGGFSTSKTLLLNLPEKYAKDLNHGMVELVVDAIVLEEYYRGYVSLYVPEAPELIHEGAVGFYNRNITGSLSIPRANIISCVNAVDMTFAWQNCLQTNIFLASMLAEETWFSEIRDGVADYREPYDRSLSLINGSSAVLLRRPVIAPIFVDAILPPRITKAGETADSENNGGGYYRFLNTVSERARDIGGGQATKESTRQAINQLSKDVSIPAEDRAWAAAMFEMTNGRNETRAELERNINGRILSGRDGSVKGAEGGRRTSLLPYLPCSVLIFLISAVLFWLLRTRKEVK